MDSIGGVLEQTVARALDHELDLVYEAVALVASGRSPRVVVAGLRFAELLVEPARRRASGLTVRVTPIWQAGEPCMSIAVERASGA